MDSLWSEFYVDRVEEDIRGCNFAQKFKKKIFEQKFSEIKRFPYKTVIFMRNELTTLQQQTLF